MSPDVPHPKQRIPRSGNGMEQLLLDWFHAMRRDLPWRHTTDPYAIWLSETMLQQTQVETVKPYFLRFLSRFPTISALAQADLQEVLSLWAGLGYYRRARHLHLAAKMILAEFSGQMPQSVEELLRLPGVGRYTAGAVASLAFGHPTPVVDGNVMRVLARLTAHDADIADPKSAAFFWTLAQSLHDSLQGSSPKSHRPHGDLNEALMELGATVCTAPPSTPACLLCPIKDFCRAHAEGRQMQLPVKSKKAATPIVRGVALVVIREHRGHPEVLLMQRPFAGLWSEMWEFPVMPLKKALRTPKLIEPTLEAYLQSSLAVGRGLIEHGEEIRHQLTHRLHIYHVVRIKLKGDGSIPKLPACLGSKSHYQHYRWLPWPLPKDPRVPLAQIVHKVAAAACS